VHLLEGYVLAPLLSIVGLPGVFLATPLVASLRVLVLDVDGRRVLERDTPLVSVAPAMQKDSE
jgi:hypothetical protein